MDRAGDDAYGLSEIVKALSARHASLSEEATVAAARAALRALLDAGKVRLYWERWASSMPREVVPDERLQAVLEDPAAWQPGSRYVCLAAPDAPGRVV